MAIPSLAAAELDVDLLPFRGDCVRCFAEVLVVCIAGADVVVEVDEVLEAFPCPTCKSVADHGNSRSGSCSRCFDSGVVGERLPVFGVALAADGSARYFTGGRPSEGEGLHVEHVCR